MESYVVADDANITLVHGLSVLQKYHLENRVGLVHVGPSDDSDGLLVTHVL